MPPPICLITGATGFVGSHLAEACASHGYAARGFVRPGSDIGHLKRTGIELAYGDLTDAASLLAASVRSP